MFDDEFTISLSDRFLRELPPLSIETRKLYCSDNLLSELVVPEEMTHLDVSFNKLVCIDVPRDLESLDVSHNKIVWIKESVFGNNKLRILRAPCNKLRFLSERLCANLTTLDLSDNKLVSLPPLSPSLRTLIVTNNKLTSLASLANLKELQVVDCRKNRLSVAPKFHPQTKLWRVDLGQNDLTYLNKFPGFVRQLDYQNTPVYKRFREAFREVWYDILAISEPRRTNLLVSLDGVRLWLKGIKILQRIRLKSATITLWKLNKQKSWVLPGK